MIRLRILGAGGAVPTPTHTPAAYWVTADGFNLLLDPGPGALVRLVKSGDAPGGVDDIHTVLLTHLHPDHTGDLVALLFALHSPLPACEAPLRLFGPPGLKNLLARLGGIYGSWLVPRKRALEVTEVRPGFRLALGSGGAAARAFAVDHPQDRLSEMQLGWEFTGADGGRLVFSGDTGDCPSLRAAARGCDLLVIECSTTDDWDVPGHLNPTQVGAVCAAAGPRRVVLTHQYPNAAALDLPPLVARHFAGPVEQARDGDVYMVSAPPRKEPA
jgi:ribonuclease BN (tRNA processing enzyme)